MARGLTDKQKAFVAEYLVDLNATQAAVRAGYSAKTAYSTGQENLKKPEIQDAIQQAQCHREKRTLVTQDRVVAELAKIAFGDARDVMRWGPGGVVLVPSDILTDDQAASVAEVSESTTKDGGSIKLKRHDKVKALELLGRHLGMWNDKLDISGKLERIGSMTDAELDAEIAAMEALRKP